MSNNCAKSSIERFGSNFDNQEGNEEETKTKYDEKKEKGNFGKKSRTIGASD
jgi:hypothetical protein